MRRVLAWLIVTLWIGVTGSAWAFSIQPRTTSKSGFPTPSGQPLTAVQHDAALYALASLGLARGPTQTLTAGGQIDCRSQAMIPVAGSGGPVTLTSNPQIITPTDLPTTKMCLLEGTSDTDTVTLVEGNGLTLKTPSLTLGAQQLALLAYNGTDWLLIGGADSVQTCGNNGVSVTETLPQGQFCYYAGIYYAGTPTGNSALGQGATGQSVLPVCADPRTNTPIGSCCFDPLDGVEYCGNGTTTLRQSGPSGIGPLPACADPQTNTAIGACCWNSDDSQQYCGDGTTTVLVGFGPSGLLPACSSPPTNTTLGDCCHHLTENVLYCGDGSTSSVMGPATACASDPPTSVNLPAGRICATSTGALWVGTDSDPVLASGAAGGAIGTAGSIPYNNAGTMEGSGCSYSVATGLSCPKLTIPCDVATETCVDAVPNESAALTDPVTSTVVNRAFVNGAYTFWPGGGVLHTILDDQTTATRSVEWGAGAMATDGTECLDAADVTVSAAGIGGVGIVCPMPTAETSGYLYGSATLPACYNSGTVTFTITAILDNDGGAGTFYTNVAAQAVAHQGTVSTFSTGVVNNLVEASGDVQWDVLQVTSAAVTISGSPAPGNRVFWRVEMCDTDASPPTSCTSSTASTITDLTILSVTMNYTCVLAQ